MPDDRVEEPELLVDRVRRLALDLGVRQRLHARVVLLEQRLDSARERRATIGRRGLDQQLRVGADAVDGGQGPERHLHALPARVERVGDADDRHGSHAGRPFEPQAVAYVQADRVGVGLRRHDATTRQPAQHRADGRALVVDPVDAPVLLGVVSDDGSRRVATRQLGHECDAPAGDGAGLRQRGDLAAAARWSGRPAVHRRIRRSRSAERSGHARAGRRARS
jgi:hypothetical protein